MIGLQQKVVRYPVFYKIINLSNYGFLIKKNNFGIWNIYDSYATDIRFVNNKEKIYKKTTLSC